MLVFLALCLTATAGAGLTSRINAVIGRKTNKNVDFTVKVIRADTGKTLYERNAAKSMIPASNMKIITTAAALTYLGPDYQFTTRIEMLGSKLVVIGAGDPLLGDQINDKKHNRPPGWLIEDIIETLKENKITRVTDIIIDSTFFDDIRVNPSWDKAILNQPYACEVSGLNYNNNCVEMNIKRAAKGTTLTVKPQTSFIKTVNKVTLISKGKDAVGAYRNGKPNELIIKGKCRKETTFRVAIEKPATFFGHILSERLKKAGIKVTGRVYEKYVKSNAGTRILRIYKTPLTEVLARCNKDSFNMAAEALVKTISAENTVGKINGQWAHGHSLISRYLRGLGIPSEQYTLDDGSGLSRKNRLSTEALTTVLFSLYKSSNWKTYKDSLGIGGVDGTCSDHFKEEKYKGKVFGKTGYINGVRALSGICSTEKGDYIFSILTKGGSSTVRTSINDIAKAIIDEN